MTERKRRMATAAGVLAAVSLAALLALPIPAMAHADVADSNPKDGETVSEAPAEAWVKFGGFFGEDQPFTLQDGSLEVIDACGTQVDEGDSHLNDTMDTILVSSGGTMAGRYELHYFITALDGAEQAGSLDFNVDSGATCDKVERSDAEGDLDHGIDATMVRIKEKAGLNVVKVKTTGDLTCGTFAPSSEEHLELSIDTNDDGEQDHVGTYFCNARKKLRLEIAEVSSGDDEEAEPTTTRVGVYKAFLNRAGKVVTAKIDGSAFAGDDGHLDLFARSYSDSDECNEETVCQDRAPDLGVLRAF